MKIIAHGCGNDRYPALTILSARHSLASGADYAELDVRFTSDGTPVVCHDDNALSLFGSPAKIAELTRGEFLALRRRSDPAFPSHTLEDFFRAGVKRLVLHLKVGGERIGEVLSLCRRCECLGDVVFGVQSPADAERVRRYGKSLRTLAFMPSPADIPAFCESGVDFIRFWEKEDWLTPDNFALAASHGKPVWIMTRNPSTGVTTDENLRAWKAAGIDGVLLNKVEGREGLQNEQ